MPIQPSPVLFRPGSKPPVGPLLPYGYPANAPPVPTQIPICWLSSPVMLRMEQPYTTAAITRTGAGTYPNASALNRAEYGDFAYTAELDTPTTADPANLAHWTVTYRSVPKMRSPQLAINLMFRSDTEKVMLLRIKRWSRIELTGVPPEFPAGAASLVVAGMKHQISLAGRMLYITTAPMVTGTTGLFLPGTTGNYASTPDDAALDVTGDIDLRADLTTADWTPAAAGTLVAKWVEPTNNRSCLFYLATNGTLGLVWSTNGTNVFSVASTVSVSAPASGRLAVRATLDVDNGAAGNTTTFYTAPTVDGPWTQLGATVVQGGVTSIFSGAAVLEVGTHSAGTLSPLAGTFHAVEVRNGIGGTVVAAPYFKDQPLATGAFTDSAGRAWTVNRSGQNAAAVVVPGRPWFRYGASLWGGPDIIPF